MVDNTHHEIDAATGTPTTGHEWDGIKELNTPLPKWWLYLSLRLYRLGAGLLGSLSGHSAAGRRDQGHSRLVVARRRHGGPARTAARVARKWLASSTARPCSRSRRIPRLAEFARAYGRSAFGVNCAPCHGANGQGSKGYPNLTADRWLWGGSLDQISATITHGARFGDPDGHQGDMPAWGSQGLNTQQIADVANYVYSLSHKTTDDVSAGKKVFADNCAACHGADAKGNPDMGAPNLTTKIWLYGGDKADLIQTITYGRGGHMPAWGSKLDPATIKSLTVYVHSLGGGQ